MYSDGTGSIFVEPSPRFPATALSLELGEFLYQLRAALDAIVFQAAILESGQDPPPNDEALEFPLCTSRRDFEKSRWKLRPLSDQRCRIVESVQPYNIPDLEPRYRSFNFNRCLGMLHDLARRDRHRRPHVSMAWASNISPLLLLPAGVSLISLAVTSSGLPLNGETQVAQLRLNGWVPGMGMKVNPNLAIDIAVAGVPPPEHDNDTLAQRMQCMVHAVAETVKRFEMSFGVEST